MNDRIAAKLKDLPETPGVYIMHDESGTVIYVGKAVVLKNRVRQYFQNTEKQVKVQAMVDNIADFEYIITRTEKDALALENNLIKKYKPHYNILLKDDKTNPYIRIDPRAEYPTIEVTRRVKRDGARYFGPFIGVSVRDVISVLQSVYRLRTCSGKLGKRARPCLDHDIDLCLAPCCGLCDPAEYRRAVNGAMSFLSGGGEDVSDIIMRKMNEAAEKENFERAISYRNQLRVLQTLKSKVVGELGSIVDIDSFYYTDNGIYGAVSVCIVRGGKMMGVKSYIINEPQVFGGDMSTFLPQYYSMTNELPDEICLQSECDTAPLVDYFSSVFSKRITITFPKKGMRKKLLDTAARNCSDYLLKSADRVKRDEDMTVGACERLRSILGIKSARRIECYDISDISGVDAVASGVVFIDGKADKAQYRRYRIRTVTGADDFRSMYETLSRRLLRYKNGDPGFDELPDLIVIDGGIEQVEFASRAADDAGVQVPFVGLAKRDEELYLRGDRNPIKLKRDDYALKLLQRVRDEAHRFAVLYHRTLRSRRYESELKSIRGVGAATVKKVLEKFNTRTIAEASASELAEKTGIPKSAAQNIYDYYHPKESNAAHMKYRLIASDLDGTLLNDELNISDANAAAINKFRAAGGIFTVATGRSKQNITRFFDRLGITDNPVPLICQMGSMIVDSASLETLEMQAIDGDTASALIEFASPKCAAVQMYDTEKIMVEDLPQATREYFAALGTMPTTVESLSETAKCSALPIIKVIFLADKSVVEGTISELREKFPMLGIVRSTAPIVERIKVDGKTGTLSMIECISIFADKGEALKRVAAGYGIPMSEVLAFGDSFNDVAMIKAAGTGVAMANAPKEIRDIASFVAPSNNEDGVAKTIERLCFTDEGGIDNG